MLMRAMRTTGRFSELPVHRDAEDYAFVLQLNKTSYFKGGGTVYVEYMEAGLTLQPPQVSRPRGKRPHEYTHTHSTHRTGWHGASPGLRKTRG